MVSNQDVFVGVRCMELGMVTTTKGCEGRLDSPLEDIGVKEMGFDDGWFPQTTDEDAET